MNQRRMKKPMVIVNKPEKLSKLCKNKVHSRRPREEISNQKRSGCTTETVQALEVEKDTLCSAEELWCMAEEFGRSNPFEVEDGCVDNICEEAEAEEDVPYSDKDLQSLMKGLVQNNPFETAHERLEAYQDLLSDWRRGYHYNTQDRAISSGSGYSGIS